MVRCEGVVMRSRGWVQCINDAPAHRDPPECDRHLASVNDLTIHDVELAYER